MSIRTYTIAMRADVTPEGHEAIKEIVRQVGAQLRAGVLLLNDGRYKPAVVVQSEDSFYETEEISLDDPL